MLGDDVRNALPELRAHALSRMTSAVRVERVLSVTADPLTGADVVTAATVHAALPCRVKASESAVQPRDVAGVDVPERPDQIHFPWDTAGLEVGQRVTVTASRNPILVGRVYRLVRSHIGDDATAQRWGVESWQ